MEGIILIVILAALLLLILASCVKIVPQAQAFIVERLGGYQGTWEVGMHFKTPFVDRVAKRVNLKEQVVDFDPQPVITKDNVTMQIDTVVFFQITDPKLFTYGVENPIMAIENLTATTLRNIIGDMELDHLFGKAKLKVDGDIADIAELGGNSMSEDIFGDDGLKRFDFGLGLKAGVEFSKKYQVAISYDFGLVEVIKEVGMKNRNLMISLGYMF